MTEAMSSDGGGVSVLAAKTALDRRIAELIAPVTADMGFELVRVRLSGGRRPTLQVMAEKPDGTMNVEECAELSRTLSALLDVEDPIEREYMLEVSSPGIDRPLTRKADFARWVGFEARLELAEAVDGRKRYKGVLRGVDPSDGRVLIETTGEDGAEPAVSALAFESLGDAKLLLTDALIAASLKGQAPGAPAADGAEIEIAETADPADEAAPDGRPDPRTQQEDR